MSANDSEDQSSSERGSYRDEPDHTNPKNRSTGDDDRDEDAEDRAADDADAEEARAEVEELGEQVGIDDDSFEQSTGDAESSQEESASAGTGETGGGASETSATGQASAGGGDATTTATSSSNTDGAESQSEPVIGEDEDTFSKADLQNAEVPEALVERLNEDTRANFGEAEIEQLRTLGDDNLTPDADDHVNLDNGVKFESIGLSGRKGGASEAAMWVVTTDEGDEMYVTFDTAATVGNPLESARLAKAFDEALPPRTSNAIGFPDIHVDEERGASALESVGAYDAEPVTYYDIPPSASGFREEDYLSAIAGKVLLGDTDLGGNIVTSSDGRFHPIDFDLAGNSLEEEESQIRNGSGLFADMDSVWEKAESRAGHALRSGDFDIDSEDIREHTQEIASQIDVDELEASLDADDGLSDEKAKTLVENVRWAQKGD